MFTPILRIQKQLRPTHPLDGRHLPLVRTLHNGHAIPASNLIRLHIERHGPIGGLVALPAQFLRTGLAGDAVVVDDGEFLAADADDDADFIGGSAAGEDDEVVEFVAGEGVLAGGDFGGFLELRYSYWSVGGMCE